MFSKIRNSIIAFFVISLFFHLLIYKGASLFDSRLPKFKKNKVLEFVVLDQKPKNDQKKMQIVEQDKKRVNDEVPEDTKYLGRHNQKVIQETRAAKTGNFNNTGQNGKREVTKKEPPKQDSGRTNLGTLPTLDKLRPTFSMKPKTEKEIEALKGSNSQSNDRLKDVGEGLQTLLSTREFVYYSYYQRIREKIRALWEPMIREKVRKVFASGRTIASSRDRVTQVVIILDKEGSLITVKVIGQSGLTDIDDAAIEAFRLAEPFPNPPKGIVEKDGTIRIRWDFVLEARKGPPPTKKKKQIASRKGLRP